MPSSLLPSPLSIANSGDHLLTPLCKSLRSSEVTVTIVFKHVIWTSWEYENTLLITSHNLTSCLCCPPFLSERMSSMILGYHDYANISHSDYREQQTFPHPSSLGYTLHMSGSFYYHSYLLFATSGMFVSHRKKKGKHQGMEMSRSNYNENES